MHDTSRGLPKNSLFRYVPNASTPTMRAEWCSVVAPVVVHSLDFSSPHPAADPLDLTTSLASLVSNACDAVDPERVAAIVSRSPARLEKRGTALHEISACTRQYYEGERRTLKPR